MQTAFKVVDAGGEEFIIAADNLADAYAKFRAWEKEQPVYEGAEDEIEEPQAIMTAGVLIPTPAEVPDEPDLFK